MGHNYWLWLGLSILNAILLFFATTKFLLSMQQLDTLSGCIQSVIHIYQG